MSSQLGRRRDGRASAAALLAIIVSGFAGGCSTPTVGPSAAARTIVAPTRDRVGIALEEDGTVAEYATPISAQEIPKAARTAVERERPGGQMIAASLLDRGGSTLYRIAKLVQGERSEYDVSADGRILCRRIEIAGGTEPYDQAIAAGESFDTGGSVESVLRESGSAGEFLILRKRRADATFLVILAKTETGWVGSAVRRLVPAEICVTYSRATPRP